MANKPFNPGFEQGKGISARRLQLMRDRRLTGIRGGRGILVREMDDGEGGIQALVETKTGLRGSGGGNGEAGTPASSPPPDIAPDGETGTDTDYARADHTHGLWHVGVDHDALESLAEQPDAPAFGHTTEDDQYWVKNDMSSASSDDDEWSRVMRAKEHLLGVVTDSAADRPTGYAQVAWVTDTIPTNWANNDFCVKKPSTP